MITNRQGHMKWVVCALIVAAIAASTRVGKAGANKGKVDTYGPFDDWNQCKNHFLLKVAPTRGALMTVEDWKCVEIDPLSDVIPLRANIPTRENAKWRLIVTRKPTNPNPPPPRSIRR